MNSLWIAVRNFFLSLFGRPERRVARRPSRRRLSAEPLESRALPSAGPLGGGGPLGGRGKSILAPGQASLTLANEDVTHGQSGPGGGAAQATQATGVLGTASFPFSPSGPGYPLPPGTAPRTGGEIALAPQLDAVLVPFGGAGGALPLVPTQSTFSLSVLGSVEVLGAPALPSVPTQSTFALAALGSADATALGRAPVFDELAFAQPAPHTSPTSITSNAEVNSVSL